MDINRVTSKVLSFKKAAIGDIKAARYLNGTDGEIISKQGGSIRISLGIHC